MPFSHETKQALFDEAAKAIIQQGRLCMVRDNCVYDDQAGNHCAIGHLLKARGVELQGLDGRTSVGVHSAKGLFRALLSGRTDGAEDYGTDTHKLLDGLKVVGADCEEDLEFLLRLQQTHDGARRFDYFRHNMTGLAQELGLNTLALGVPA